MFYIKSSLESLCQVRGLKRELKEKVGVLPSETEFLVVPLYPLKVKAILVKLEYVF